MLPSIEPMHLKYQGIIKLASRHWMIFLLLCLLPCIVDAQTYGITETSSKFLSDRDYDSMILLKARPIAISKNIAPGELESRLPSLHARFSELVYPQLFHAFKLMDRDHEHINVGDKAYNATRKKYLDVVKKTVDRVFENPQSFYPLFSFDNSDRILSFHSEVKIEENGTIHVSETIRVYNGSALSTSGSLDTLASSNDDIQRGIVRDFPTKYLDTNGLWHRTGFSVKKVFKNGKEEPYKTESLENGKRLLIGEEDKYLEAGLYTYRIDYTTKRQLIFHDDKDEFYWNVNGNGWVFTADTVSCTIHFPATSRIIEYDCYTGQQGSTAKDCRAQQVNSNTIEFTSTKKFQSYEGLTVAAAINKGVLIAPGKSARLARLVMDNFIIPVLLLLSIFLFIYYYRTWKRKGKDPEQGTIYPQFEPPPGLVAADTGYILHQKFGTHLFAATLVDAAVNKQLEIEVEKKGLLVKHTVYNFNKPNSNGNGSPILNAAGVPYEVTGNGDAWKDVSKYGFQLSSIYGQVAEKGKYNSKLKELQSSLEKTLKNRFQAGLKNKPGNRHLFTLNTPYIWIGNIIVFGALIGSFIFIANNFSVTLLIATAILLVILLTIHIVFASIMSAYTPEGRKIADNILGFRMYLETAEQRYFDRLTPPEKTLELFEKYLPYAIALKVENEWAEKFDAQIRKAIEEGYRPAYYHTHGSFGSNFGLSELSRGLSSGLSSTISSASTPPSSSRGGSGGGGSSGGGGGGGGGGGW